MKVIPLQADGMGSDFVAGGWHESESVAGRRHERDFVTGRRHGKCVLCRENCLEKAEPENILA